MSKMRRIHQGQRSRQASLVDEIDRSTRRAGAGRTELHSTRDTRYGKPGHESGKMMSGCK